MDKRYGTDRSMVIRALGKMKNPKAVDALIELLDGETGVLPALEALGKLKAVKARTKIERFLTSKDSDLRAEAKRALAKIDRFMQKASAKMNTIL
jgi:HEAT repeat protein